MKKSDIDPFIILSLFIIAIGSIAIAVSIIDHNILAFIVGIILIIGFCLISSVLFYVRDHL